MLRWIQDAEMDTRCWDGYKMLRWIQDAEMDTRCWDGYKMLRWIQDAEMDTRKDHIRNVTIRKKAHVKPINTLVMKKRLSWFGHVQWRDEDNVAKYVLNTRIDGSRPRAEVDGAIKRRKTRYAENGHQTGRAGSTWWKTATLPRKWRKGEKSETTLVMVFHWQVRQR